MDKFSPRAIHRFSLPTVRSLLRAEDGRSLISMLAALLAVGVLGALMLGGGGGGGGKSNPQALQQATGQAQDVAAQTLLHDAQTAVATYVASSSGGYSGVSAAALNQIEPTLVTSSTTDAYLASASGTSDGYTVVAVDPLSHNQFTLTSSSGVVTHSCTTAGNGGCPASGTW